MYHQSVIYLGWKDCKFSRCKISLVPSTLYKKEILLSLGTSQNYLKLHQQENSQTQSSVPWSTRNRIVNSRGQIWNLVKKYSLGWANLTFAQLGFRISKNQCLLGICIFFYFYVNIHCDYPVLAPSLFFVYVGGTDNLSF